MAAQKTGKIISRVRYERRDIGAIFWRVMRIIT